MEEKIGPKEDDIYSLIAKLEKQRTRWVVMGMVAYIVVIGSLMYIAKEQGGIAAILFLAGVVAFLAERENKDLEKSITRFRDELNKCSTK